jgi:hypothetical protein
LVSGSRLKFGFRAGIEEPVGVRDPDHLDDAADADPGAAVAPRQHAGGLQHLDGLGDGACRMQHGKWGTMVESDLPFNRHTAHKLMQIAGDKRLTNVSQGKHLPPSWTTLYELTKLDDDTHTPACGAKT